MTRSRKSKSPWRRALFALALAAYSLAALLPFEQVVLCVRADGHVGLEAPGAGSGCIDCARSLASSDPAGCCARAEKDHGKAPCRDTVVLQHRGDPGVPPSACSVPGAAMLLAVVIERRELVAVSSRSSPVERRTFDPPRPPPFELARILRV